MGGGVKYPRSLACAVARELVAALEPACERLILAGSLRRRRPEVGDIELLYIPRHGLATPPGELLPRLCNLADLAIGELRQRGVLAVRPNVNGSAIFGELNKLMIHVASGIPVDLFAASAETWFNYLVCRTGSAETNIRICRAAKARGLRWNPYGQGFQGAGGKVYPCVSERDVFEKVGLQYLEPWER